MMKLLLADDEKYDRETLKYIIKDRFSEELEIYEAKNGREAIEISESVKPDIIIIDIKMPGIDGIQALKEISASLPNLYSIILTAYDYFDFALEAVKINVKEYLLKPFAKEEIVEKVSLGVKWVKKEQDKRKSEIEDKEKIYTLLPVLENQLSDLIINDKIKGVDYSMYLQCLNMNFKNSYAMVISLKNKYEYGDINSAEKDKIKMKIGEYIKEYVNRRYKCIGNYVFYEELTYFIQIDNEDSKDFKNLEVNLAFNLRREIKKRFNVSIRAGLGKIVNSVEEMIESYRQAMKSLVYNSDSVNIIHIDDIDDKLVSDMLNEIKTNRSKNINNKVKTKLFENVKNFIKENIETELELERVANNFGLSVYYFSRTFKEVTGINFSEYVNKCRIDIAKELLSSGELSIKEVCYKVGYNDPNYFSKVFKKYEGISPVNFKA
ncbi:two component transcriptional regulator, AraC family [Clostridium sp. DL-VIII]|uniref:response regulator transcription factor n=1 Tax=Clostridium sp. DL-VIII TaxID=641107 RepID=UPI00023B077D|nr:response regulator [Clostridium sp. DL-VIII]EHJ01620.1 two component transcriptional regulator, AraC family [Clostridium sp. DL-VIII]